MNFLNPFFLFGSVALAVPFLIHLVRKEKTEIIPFSSLMFLLRVPKSSIRQQKIKNLLLMMLRLLLLALLVAAFARPYLMQPSVQAAAGAANRGIVLLLDNSYSMGYGDNFTKLKAEADKRISAMKSTDKMTIVVFNDKASPLGLPTGDQAALHAAVSTIELSNGGTRFYDAFTMADRAFQPDGYAGKADGCGFRFPAQRVEPLESRASSPVMSRPSPWTSAWTIRTMPESTA